MGLARRNPGGQWRLGLSATAASAVLYTAIVLFGVGSASPSAPAAGRDPHASAVLMQARAGTVSGSAQKLPQASAEPRRHRSRARARQPRTAVAAPEAPAQTSSAPSTVADPTPASPRATESDPPASVASSTTDSVADSPLVVTVPIAPVPPVTVPLPELPVPLPELPVPQPEPLPLPLPVP
jgi:hypothetical protein